MREVFRREKINRHFTAVFLLFDAHARPETFAKLFFQSEYVRRDEVLVASPLNRDATRERFGITDGEVPSDDFLE